MFVLNALESLQVSGGQQESDYCYNAYYHMEQNAVSFYHVLIFFALTPLGLVGSVLGQYALVENICGSEEALELAKKKYSQIK